MKALLQEAARRARADYVDIRLEETRRTAIRFVGPQLDQIGESVHYGGAVRALVKGGWGFVSFNRLDDLDGLVQQAVRQAVTIASTGVEPVRLAPVARVDVTVPLDVDADPRQVSLDEKKRLLEGYNRLILEQGPPIQSSSIHYFDRHIHLWFASSEGTWVEQEKIDLGCNIIAIAAAGGPPQQKR